MPLYANGIEQVNTPAFHARLSSNQTISSGVTTKIQINDETFDTDNCYDNSTNYRFTPTTAGKYYVYLQARFSWNSGNGDEASLWIYLNGSEKFKSKINIVSNFYGTMNAYGIVDMNGSSDYLEAYGAYDASLPTITGGVHTHFGAYKIVE
jgi:hypothetical protein